MGLLAAIAGMLRAPAPPDPAARQGLERIGELVDPFLKSAPGFAHKLAAPVHHALGYCEGLVASLPGPVDVGRRAFAADPLVHALFATADDIGRMLGSSQAIRDYLADPACWQNDHFYALLAARRMEKHQLGMAMAGEVIRTEVPQTVLYFSGHTLVEPRCELDATRTQLRDAAFDSLLKSFHAHLDALRQEKSHLSSDYSAERAHLTVLRGRGGEGELSVHTRRLAELDAHLRAVAESLMPEPLEEALAAFLLKPEMSLRLDPVTVKVDSLGIVAASDADDATTLSFPELCGRDRRRHLLMLARIDRDEAREAVECFFERQRRYLII